MAKTDHRRLRSPTSNQRRPERPCFGPRSRLPAAIKGTRTHKRGDHGRPRTVRRIERGDGDDGEPVRSPSEPPTIRAVGQRLDSGQLLKGGRIAVPGEPAAYGA